MGPGPREMNAITAIMPSCGFHAAPYPEFPSERRKVNAPHQSISLLDIRPMSDPLSGTGVLQVLPSLTTGGVEKGTVEIAAAIVRAGGRSVGASAGGRMVSELERSGTHHETLPMNSKNPVTLLGNAFRLVKLIRRDEISIVHARSRAPAWSAWLAARLTGAHFITTYHGTYSDGFRLKRHYNAVMARGEIVIVASQFIAGLITERHHVPPEKIRIVPRGVDPAVFDPTEVSRERTDRLRARWGIPAGVSVVLLPGRLTSWKGQSVLIDAIARVRSRTLCCILVGSDQGRKAYSQSLLDQARRLGLADRVFLVGECDDMPAALSLADVVVHASIKPEAFGRVVIEAQAMGRPVIASDLGGPVETVRHGETGWRVRPNDPQALAIIIQDVLSLLPERLMVIGAQARVSVPTVASMQAATIAAYQDVLAATAKHENIP